MSRLTGCAGEVVDGLIHGQGEYQSGFGDVMKVPYINHFAK